MSDKKHAPFILFLSGLFLLLTPLANVVSGPGLATFGTILGGVGLVWYGYILGSTRNKEG